MVELNEISKSIAKRFVTLTKSNKLGKLPDDVVIYPGMEVSNIITIINWISALQTKSTLNNKEKYILRDLFNAVDYELANKYAKKEGINPVAHPTPSTVVSLVATPSTLVLDDSPIPPDKPLAEVTSISTNKDVKALTREFLGAIDNSITTKQFDHWKQTLLQIHSQSDDGWKRDMCHFLQTVITAQFNEGNLNESDLISKFEKLTLEDLKVFVSIRPEIVLMSQGFSSKTDFEKLIKEGVYKYTLFIFNDNENILLNNHTHTENKGNAIIRPYEDKLYIQAFGIPIGTYVQSNQNTFKELEQLIRTYKYNKIIYFANADDKSATSIFKQLKIVVDKYNNDFINITTFEGNVMAAQLKNILDEHNKKNNDSQAFTSDDDIVTTEDEAFTSDYDNITSEDEDFSTDDDDGTNEGGSIITSAPALPSMEKKAPPTDRASDKSQRNALLVAIQNNKNNTTLRKTTKAEKKSGGGGGILEVVNNRLKNRRKVIDSEENTNSGDDTDWDTDGFFGSSKKIVCYMGANKKAFVQRLLYYFKFLTKFEVDKIDQNIARSVRKHNIGHLEQTKNGWFITLDKKQFHRVLKHQTLLNSTREK
jgi:hypothetical protein